MYGTYGFTGELDLLFFFFGSTGTGKALLGSRLSKDTGEFDSGCCRQMTVKAFQKDTSISFGQNAKSLPKGNGPWHATVLHGFLQRLPGPSPEYLAMIHSENQRKPFKKNAQKGISSHKNYPWF